MYSSCNLQVPQILKKGRIWSESALKEYREIEVADKDIVEEKKITRTLHNLIKGAKRAKKTRSRSKSGSKSGAKRDRKDRT